MNRQISRANEQNSRLRGRRWIPVVCILIFLTLPHPVSGHPLVQTATGWSPSQTIPGFHPDSNPPILLADQNRTVHALSSQWLDETSGYGYLAISYNQWTLEGGWTLPNDILLPPIKLQARLLDAFLDVHGIIHMVFFSGDETGAGIFYSTAPAVDAGKAPAWSDPIMIGPEALTYQSGAIRGDGQGNLLVLYGGSPEGRGIYAVSSTDWGDTWSQPVPIYFAASNEMTPYGLRMVLGESGWYHAVWDVNDVSGQGRSVYYIRIKTGEDQLGEPVELDAADSGLGTKLPTVIEHDGKVVVIYYSAALDGHLVERRSDDLGVTWTGQMTPFTAHVGLNGAGSLVSDSNNELHLFWGQRISGNPDRHGMWHSLWRNNQWMPPEAIVSGPRVSDHQGDRSFDPTAPMAVVRQGNVLLVTWRSDYGLKGNGIWYSYRTLDAPEIAAVPLPEPTPTVQPSEPLINQVTATPMPAETSQPQFSEVSQATDMAELRRGSVDTLLVSTLPVFVILLAVIGAHRFSRYR